MSGVTIGIFGAPSDPEVSALAERLRNRGAEAWVVDLADIPGACTLTWEAQTVRIDGRDLLDMDAAYLRRTGRRLLPVFSYGASNASSSPSAQKEDTWMAYRPKALAHLGRERAATVLRTAMLAWFARQRPLVNPPALQRLHRLKPLLLDRLRRAGVPVPDFVAGTDPAHIARFAREVSSLETPDRQATAPVSRGSLPAVVVKPLAGIYKTRAWRPSEPETHPWEDRPALVQRFARGDVVRAYVLDGRLIVAARIVHQGTVDSSESQTGIAPIRVPSSVETLAVRAAAVIGAVFCGLDLILEPTGAVVIDLNLSPMFVNFSRLSRVDIAGALADHLIRSARHRKPGSRRVALDMLGQAKRVLAEDPDLAAFLAGVGRRRG